MEAERHIIWSDLNLDYDDWREYLQEEYPDRTEDEYRMLMHDINEDYLDDERSNLNIQLSMPILVCADLGLWNGRKTGYRMIHSGNIRDCLFGSCDYNEWFVDQKGDLRCTAVHHDGTNHYLYRAVREGVPEWRVEWLQDKLYRGKATEADIAKVTRRIGDEIAAVYGYDIPETDEKERSGMERVDAKEEVFDEIELLERTGLFTELRVNKDTIPDGVYCYELRHGDDDSFPVEVEEKVGVNYFGAVFMTEKLELDKEGKLPIEYEDFGYTGEEMKLEAFIARDKERKGKEPDCFQSGQELARFLEPAFSMTAEECDKLLGYMEGHGFLLGCKNEELYRGDMCHAQEETLWEPYSIDDAVNVVTEWNYELLKQAEADMSNSKDMIDFVNKKSYLDTLREDEKILDAIFDRTKYGKELDAVAIKLAEAFIQNMSREGIDVAVKEMAAQIKAEENMLSGISPVLEQNRGRAK